MPAVPAIGHLGTGDSEQTMMARLERLEASQDRIEAAIIGITGTTQQSQIRNRTYDQHSLQPYWQNIRSGLYNGLRHSHRTISRWHNAQIYVTGCYIMLIAATCLRFTAWIDELFISHTDPVDGKRNAAVAAKCRREAERMENVVYALSLSHGPSEVTGL